MFPKGIFRRLANVLIIMIGIHLIVIYCVIPIVINSQIPDSSELEDGRSLLITRMDLPFNTPHVPDTEKTDRNENRVRDVLVDQMLDRINNYSRNLYPSWYLDSTLEALTKYQHLKMTNNSRKVFPDLLENDFERNDTISPWKLVNANIRQYYMYDIDDPNLHQLLNNLETLPIVKLREFNGGTQLDLHATLSDGTQALMKPMRYERDYQTPRNTFQYDIIERHFAEVAAFHLDKVLGFYRVPPTTGRIVNITSEILPLASKKFNDTVFRGKRGNTCFHGNCLYWCDHRHAFCGEPDVIEVSMMMWIPLPDKHRIEYKHPWKRSYDYRQRAPWETNDEYCDEIRQSPPYNRGNMLLDVMDLSVFDFLTGNEDRHGFLIYRAFDNNTFPIMMDNGKGFARYVDDSMPNLAPLVQCCLIRKSTFLKLIKLYQGPEKLSQLMEQSLLGNPISPVLLEGHLSSLDRRVIKILQTVAGCLEKNVVHDVIKDDHILD